MPPHGEDAALAAGRVEVERARRVAGDAFFMKGHMALDCRRTASMLAASIGCWCVFRQAVDVLVVKLDVFVGLRFFGKSQARARQGKGTLEGGGRIRGLLYSGAKVWPAVSGPGGVLEAEVRPSAPSGFEMAGVHLLGLGSKEARHSRARLLDAMCMCIAAACMLCLAVPLFSSS